MNQKMPTMSKIGVIFLSWRRFLQRELNAHNITLKQYHVLKQLSLKEFLYPSQVAEFLFSDRPTVTVIIKNMEREGWIKRVPDEDNGRQVKLYLTESGRDKVNQLKEFDSNDRYGDFEPLSCFSPEEVMELNRLLDKLGKHIDGLAK